MFDKELAAVCGVYCGSCEYYGKQCSGCNSLKGKPFWISSMKMEVCPLYDCSINKKQLEHCGFCEELPCKTFMDMRDPSLTEEAFMESVHKRKMNLLKRKETGTFDIN